VLGIKPAKPSFAEILIKPQFIYEYAQGQMPTVQGSAKVNWQKRFDQVELTVEGPQEVPIVVEMPKQKPQRFQEGNKVQIKT